MLTDVHSDGAPLTWWGRASVDAAVLPAQPLGVEQVRAGQRMGSWGVDAGESFDGFFVEPFNRGSVGQHRRGARVVPSAQSVPAACAISASWTSGPVARSA
jgi:hypothetical protein